MRRILLPVCGILFFLLPCIAASAVERLQETDGEKIVIVIDPGHGGENEGTLSGSVREKDMTLTTAMAMYEELLQYDDAEVYLTRTQDVDLSLSERAAFAESVDADFLFSIHYNASENHGLFGSEIWIPKDAPFNGYGYQFGYEFLSLMQERGLFIRGIKTRVGDQGLDYYGIIRNASARGIPAVILEHCHVDEARDLEFCDSEEDLIRFGKDDATAVAKYFGLKSRTLQTDFSAHELQAATAEVPVSSTLRDESAPDVCRLTLSEADYETGLLSIEVMAADYDSVLLYYDYSIDGGISYSERIPWPESDALSGTYADTFTLNLTIPSGVQPSVSVRAYNLYDLCTTGNPIRTEEAFSYGGLTEGAEPDDAKDSSEAEADGGSGTEGTAYGDETDDAHTVLSEATEAVSFLTFLKLSLAAVALLFLLLFFSQLFAHRKRRRKRCQRRNDDGRSRNQHR